MASSYRNNPRQVFSRNLSIFLVTAWLLSELC